MSWRLVVLAAATCVACHEPAPQGNLAGAVAVVGARRLEAPLASQIDARAWVRLELLAQAAEQRGLLHEPHSSAQVRRLVAGWTRDAQEPRVATAAEIVTARDEQWQRYEHGPGVVVHHVVLMKKGAGSPTFDADAMALARTFATHVRPDWDFEKFSAAAKALATPPGIEARAEQLPSFVADGRALEGPSGFDPEFARQSFTLHAPGDSTAPFATRFGVHVVQLEKTVAALHASDDEVREGLAGDLVARRVQRRQGEAIQRHQPTHAVALSPTSAADMELAVRRLVGEPAP